MQTRFKFILRNGIFLMIAIIEAHSSKVTGMLYEFY